MSDVSAIINLVISRECEWKLARTIKREQRAGRLSFSQWRYSEKYNNPVSRTFHLEEAPRVACISIPVPDMLYCITSSNSSFIIIMKRRFYRRQATCDPCSIEYFNNIARILQIFHVIRVFSLSSDKILCNIWPQYFILKVFLNI